MASARIHLKTGGPAAGAGYADPGYAGSLKEFGTPRELSRCGGWLLQRRIPSSEAQDAMGTYPLFCCRDWGRLPGDLEEIAGGLVSLALVADPFGNHDQALLRSCFPDRMNAFKNHLVVDYSQPLRVSKHHRYYARRAMKTVKVEVCEPPGDLEEDWCRLYEVLIRRHAISGIRAFSRKAFAEQLRLPGLTAIRGVLDGETVGAHLWFEGAEGVAFSHLAAFSDKGYEHMASYALYSFALDHFRAKGSRFLDIGADAGSAAAEEQGLGAFKRGWCNGSRTVYFCGRVFDRARYDELTAGAGQGGSGYFPAYRAGEFR